jgi:HK97 family phage major capsid protein
MDKILDLRQKRAKIWEDAKAFLDAHEDKDGTLSAEDAQTYDAMEADIVKIGDQLSRLERQEALDRELSQPVNAPITHKPEAPNPEEKTGKASREYAFSF